MTDTAQPIGAKILRIADRSGVSVAQEAVVDRLKRLVEELEHPDTTFRPQQVLVIALELLPNDGFTFNAYGNTRSLDRLALLELGRAATIERFKGLKED